MIFLCLLPNESTKYLICTQGWDVFILTCPLEVPVSEVTVSRGVKRALLDLKLESAR